MTIFYLAIWMFAATAFAVAITAIYGAAVQMADLLNQANTGNAALPTKLRGTKIVRPAVDVKRFEPDTNPAWHAKQDNDQGERGQEPAAA